MVHTCLLNLWVVSSCKICEGMGVRGVRRLGNSAELFQLQRMVATCCCPLRHDLRAVQESSLARARLHPQVHSSCVGTGVIAPRIPSPATSRGLSDTLENFPQASYANGRPAVETRFAVGSAISNSSMSDQALSAVAKEVVHSLLGLVVAAATLSIIART